jgi:DNA-binding response OmpR family regulator
MLNPKILLIDDDSDFRKSIQIILENKDYNVSLAANGREGFTKAKSEKPDLIILDIMLPDGDGFSICRELKETPETFQIPVIILTSMSKKRGNSYADVIAYCHKADEFMEKPVEKGELLFNIKKLLKKKNIKFQKMTGKKKILITDCDAGFVSGMEKVLLSNNFEVFVAESGIEAQKMAKAFSPDLILLEIALPDKDGYSVCYELKKNPKTSQIPVVIVSSIDNKLVSADFASHLAKEHRADMYVSKPVKPMELLKTINQIL